MKRAVFLDRDGVINRAIVRDGKPYPPANLASLEVLPGVPDAMRKLRDARWLMIVVTNQPDVARGITPLSDVRAINVYLEQHLPICEIRVCYHDDDDGCDCRKPLPGLLLGAAEAHGIDLLSSYMVGDRWRDMKAGKLAGCKTIFVDNKYEEEQPAEFDFHVHSLADAVEIILRTEI